VATSDAAFRGGACPTPEYTIAYTGNYTTSADANVEEPSIWVARMHITVRVFPCFAESVLHLRPASARRS